MVRKVTTFYCEACGSGYDVFDLAHRCEQSAQATLQVGDVILRSAKGDDVFEVERDALVWGVVKSIRSTPGNVDAPVNQHFYKTSGLQVELEETQLEFTSAGQLSFEKGLTEGPLHTRQLSVLFDTYPDMRQQMADCFAVLSDCTPVIDLTPESYVKWDDLRYTAYDFGIVAGDAPAVMKPEFAQLLSWCAQAIPAEEVHRNLFSKPQLGLHGGPRVYAPFDDNVGFRTKWLIGEGDPYRYLRFHMQPHDMQLRELEDKQAGLLHGAMVWFDRLEDLFELRSSVSKMPYEVQLWARRNGVSSTPVDTARAMFNWMKTEQQGWRIPVNITPSVVPTHIPVIAVAAGKGGVGKSTVAANFARSVANAGHRPLFLDLDFYGPSAPTEFGLEERLRIEDGYIVPHVKDGVSIVSIGNMIPPDRALHWRGPVLEAFIHLVTAHIQYDGIDVIVLDCPPGTGDVQLGIFHRIPPAGTLFVTTGSELALADVRRAVTSFRDAGVPNLGVVENMSELHVGDGEFRRLFGTRARVQGFCEGEGLQYLGSIPFMDTAPELLEHVSKVTRSVWERLIARHE